MHPSLGLMLPLLLGQPAGPPAVIPAAGFANWHAKRPAAVGCDTCPAPAVPAGGGLPPYLGPRMSPPRQVCPPVGPPAPLLAVKAVLPDGATVALDASGKTYAAGSVFGFRPGYAYRLKVAGLTDGVDVGATLEVYGSIVPRPGMKYMEYPAALFVSRTDVSRVVAGGVVTKVIYLENPEKAIPVEEKPNDPLEVAADTVRDAIDAADANGRIVAVLRIGDRTPSAAELARAYQDGTVLLPGETKLVGRPAGPPPLPCHGVPLYDPVLGPKPLPEECFPNGGDGGPRVGIGPNGRLGNLDPTDAAAEYTVGGKRQATVSNVVCLCAPRFVARRVDTTAGGLTAAVPPQVLTQVVARSVFLHRYHVEEVVGRSRTLGLDARLRPAGLTSLLVLQELAGTRNTQAIGMTEGILVVAAVVVPDELTSFPARLTLTKSLDPTGSYKSGDVVTITLKFANHTREPVTDLVIADSLSPRLEFVDGSAASDRPSNVTTADNGAGSKVVRFDIPGPIPPAGTGVAVFQVKVR